MKRILIIVTLWCGVVSAPMVARGFENERAGFEKLEFGQTIEAVRKIYPGARQLDREDLGAIVVSSPFIQRYQVAEVRLAGLPHPVSFELRFWKEKLWVVIGYFGENSRDDIVAFLTKRYGQPKSQKPDPAWIGKIAAVTMNSKHKWFSVNDQVASKEIAALLMKAMHQPTPATSGVPPTTPQPSAGAAPALPPTAPR